MTPNTKRNIGFVAIGLAVSAIAVLLIYQSAGSSEISDRDLAIMSKRFGNTTLVEDATGTTTILYREDGTLWSEFPAGQILEGNWEARRGHVCLSWPEPPPNVANPTCVLMGDHGVGETWREGGYRITLVEGLPT